MESYGQMGENADMESLLLAQNLVKIQLVSVMK